MKKKKCSMPPGISKKNKIIIKSNDNNKLIINSQNVFVFQLSIKSNKKKSNKIIIIMIPEVNPFFFSVFVNPFCHGIGSLSSC